MKVEVRFDIRDEFDVPLGNMSGSFELATAPMRGDRIDIAPRCDVVKELGFPAEMAVMAVEPCEPHDTCDWIAWLEDLYVGNVATGRPLVHALERQLGLSLFPYRDGLE